LGSVSDNILKQLEQIFKNQPLYQVKSDAVKRNLDAVNPTAANNAKVLATLINDLKKQKILK